jgi:hypothetical protein
VAGDGQLGIGSAQFTVNYRDSIEVKRLAVGKTVTVTVRGTPFVLAVGAGANAKGVAEGFERVKAPA